MTLGDCGREVTSITCDSRRVTDGSLFIAVKGFSVDGHSYIGKAVEAGAAAIIYEESDAADIELYAGAGNFEFSSITVTPNVQE